MKGKGHLESTGRAVHLEMGVFVHARSCSIDTMTGAVLLPLETVLSKSKQICALLVPYWCRKCFQAANKEIQKGSTISLSEKVQIATFACPSLLKV